MLRGRYLVRHRRMAGVCVMVREQLSWLLLAIYFAVLC